MCGIAAIFSSEKRNLSSSILKMTDTIRYRGPDGEGFALVSKGMESRFLSGPDTPKINWKENIAYRPSANILETQTHLTQGALGHRRLSILDLTETGHQPMMRENSGNIITFNGEIYNYIELRKELEGMGHRFISNSDTEVLLCAYEEWGTACLNRFNGMFAFVIYDKRSNKFFAARDRFAVKPLYYWKSPEGFLAFASEIKQFTVLPGWNARMNHQRAHDYLGYGLTDHTSETLFEDVYQLRGGEMAECSLDNIKSGLHIKKWYELKQRTVSGDFMESAKVFKEMFNDSIKLRLRSDVPVGIALSGGLDSSSIVCSANELFKQLGSGVLHTFSSCATDSRFDESKYVKKVIEKTGATPHYTYPGVNELFDILPRMTWHLDEPFSSTSIFAEWKVYELAALSSIKVSLDGHGADELLAGYHSFFIPYYTSLIRNLKMIKLITELKNANIIHGHSPLKMIKQVVFNSFIPKSYRNIKNSSTNEGWINLRALDADKSSPFDLDSNHLKSVRNFSTEQLLSTSLPQQLKWADRNSMAHSIESRAPFLDYRLVEFIMGCPDDFKIGKSQTKRILRKAMNGTLPPEVRDRQDKMGFVTPEMHWLKSEASERFLSAVDKSIEQSKGVIKKDAHDVVKNIIDGNTKFNFIPWRIISFGGWIEKFSVKTD